MDQALATPHARMLAQSLRRPLVGGNRVALLQDGSETFGAMFDAIDRARDHINVSSYIVENQGPGEELLRRLVGRRREGVQVNLSFDGAGCLGTSRRVFDALRRDGISLLEHNPIHQLSTWVGQALQRRNHRKLMVVDGGTGFIGGLNICGAYSGPAALAGSGGQDWRDTHVRVQGPVVGEMQKLFLGHWRRCAGRLPEPARYFDTQHPPGEQLAGLVTAEGGHGRNDFYRALLAAVGAARERVLITTAYFVPPRRLLRALRTAARRGVDVQLVLPGRSDFWAPVHAGRHHFGELLRAGVRIHERHDRLLHAKTAVIDGLWATVGSHNLDWRSIVHNAEANLVVLDAGFAAQLEAAFWQDVAQCHEVILGNWQRRGRMDRLKEWTARRFEFLL